MKQITAIVGGGPAGALCGERLATAGFDVTIFDERLAWEKALRRRVDAQGHQKLTLSAEHSASQERYIRTAELISKAAAIEPVLK